MFKSLILAASVIAASIFPSQAAYRITNSPGGALFDFVQDYTIIRDSEGYLEIDGFCFSACTLFFNVVSPDHVCATPNTILGFHSSTANRQHSEWGTQWMWSYYPDYVQRYLMELGFNGGEGQAHPDMIIVEADKLMQICGEDAQSPSS